ncbi:hypothetical protein BH09MYX1_BH09MYX1_19970 [soil metagenome]
MLARFFRTSRPAVGLAAIGVAIVACSSGNVDAVGVAPSLVFPKGLLDGVTRVSVTVLDGAAGASCDAKTGVASGGGSPLASKDLASTGCASGAKFCGDLQIEKSDDDRVFGAQAFTASSTTAVASGCVRAKVNQDTLSVKIQMLRFVPPATCGGSPSPVPVQCSAPGDDADIVCGANCLSKETYLSAGSGAAGDVSDVKQKVKPLFLWPAAADSLFLGYWGDRSPGSRTQVSLRAMSDDLHATDKQGGGVQVQSFFLPNNSTGNFPPAGEAGSQFNPTAAISGAKIYVAFEDNQAGPVAISMRTQNVAELSKTDQPGQKPVVVSDASGSAQANPSMALSGGKLLVTWENGANLVAKTVDTSGALSGGACGAACGAQKTLGTGKTPVVVSTGSGFLVAYQSGSDIKLLPVDASGTPGSEIKVNDGTHTGNQEHPSVAVLPDGKIAVVWSDAGAQGGAGIFVQRFGSDLKPVAGDQTVRINDASLAVQATPTVAAGSNFFVAAWVDTASGHVRARLLDGTSGFLFNAINGQSTDFQVSVDDGHARTNPTAVVGGAGPYLAIGWQDDTGAPGSFKGIYARRFPTP